ncbi:MAG: holo-ACP synthase [Solirubrobacteraceae bacterium]
MSLRVGLDLVSAETVRESLQRHGPRYLHRVYTEREVADCRTEHGADARRLAARFAVKEATFKVLRVGKDDAVPWTAVEVRRHPPHGVSVVLTGRAAELAQAAGIRELAVSLTHEKGRAAAVVVAEIQESAGTQVVVP